MKLFGEPHHTAIAIGVVVVVMGMGLHRKPVIKSVAKPDQTAVAGLTEKDLRGTVRLTSAERQRAVWSCTREISTVNMRGRGTVRIEGSIREFSQQRVNAMSRVCECLIEQIENRANGLQFRMFLSFLGRTSGPLYAMPNYRQYWDFATAHGVSDKDFKEMTAELGSYIITSGENCESILTE